jgi:hypothetical protein
MSANRLDISDSFTWQEDLPRPQWDLLSAWVQSRVEPEERFEAWTDIARQWLTHLSSALDGPYELSESDQVLLLAPAAKAATPVLGFAEFCRTALLTGLPQVTRFNMPGKQAVLIIEDTQTYYTYLSVYYPEGHHGGSGGVHVREGYPHIVVHGTETAETTLAHEMTHASLAHLTLPVWIEEGLAQMFEHDMSGRGLQQVDAEMAREHKRYWKKHGLELSGAAKASPGRTKPKSSAINWPRSCCGFYAAITGRAGLVWTSAPGAASWPFSARPTPAIAARPLPAITLDIPCRSWRASFWGGGSGRRDYKILRARSCTEIRTELFPLTQA